MADQIVTANRLRDGAVIYLGPGHAIVETLAAAQRFTTSEALDAALAAAKTLAAEQVIVNPYPVELSKTGTPVRMREVIRAAGPTVRIDLGKQAGA